MNKLILIAVICLIPISAFSLDQMQDNELDQVTARFGVGAAGNAAPLSAPPSDAYGTAGNITPSAPLASHTVQAIIDGAYTNDRQDDTTRTTTFTVNMNNLRIAATLGFF